MAEPLSEHDLSEVEARCQDAQLALSLWPADTVSDLCARGFMSAADVPTLLAEVRRLREELHQVTWEKYCPSVAAGYAPRCYCFDDS